MGNVDSLKLLNISHQFLLNKQGQEKRTKKNLVQSKTDCFVFLPCANGHSLVFPSPKGQHPVQSHSRNWAVKRQGLGKVLGQALTLKQLRAQATLLPTVGSHSCPTCEAPLLQLLQLKDPQLGAQWSVTLCKDPGLHCSRPCQWQTLTLGIQLYVWVLGEARDIYTCFLTTTTKRVKYVNNTNALL